MRRASTCLALAVLAPAAAAPAASATPTVTLKAQAVPIPHFPNTGLKFGAGAAVKVEYTIKGTEYEGSPPPLEGVNFFLPAGTRLHPSGFPTCRRSLLEPSGPGPGACPRGSRAGPVGEVVGFVTLGGERVHERATLESFYAPGGGLEFFTAGHSPVSLEILSVGHYTHLGGGGGYGPELIAEVPLVPSLPGAPFVSVERIKVTVGSAIRSHGRTIYYGTVPRRCPKKYFPVRSELIFAAVGGLSRQVVTKTYRAPCPRRR
jgi:hypothetical protein